MLVDKEGEIIKSFEKFAVSRIDPKYFVVKDDWSSNSLTLVDTKGEVVLKGNY